MRFSHLYDHVLSELELGRTDVAVNLLVGILDTAAMQGEAALQARTELLDHPLLGMLQEDPLFGLASEPVVHSTDLGISSTGRRLSAATSETALARALRHRLRHAAAKLLRAWRTGKEILLIADPQHDLLASLNGFDTSNVTVCDIDKMGAVDGKYQLILAPCLADSSTPSQLAEFLSAASSLAAVDGEIILSALRPGHPGSGWRSICLGWQPHCHDDQQLLASMPPGLTAHIYHDESQCIAWIETRLKPANPDFANQVR